MKKTGLIILSVIILCATFMIGCTSNNTSQTDNSAQASGSAISSSPSPSGDANQQETASASPSATPITYKDGVYEGKSPVTSESYYGKAIITIKDGAITEVDFKIYDTSYFKQALSANDTSGMNEMLMDKKYGETVFASNKVYQQQVVDELAGMDQYEKILVETQDINEVDTISKATWSHTLYQSAVKDALKKAVNN